MRGGKRSGLSPFGTCGAFYYNVGANLVFAQILIFTIFISFGYLISADLQLASVL